MDSGIGRRGQKMRSEPLGTNLHLYAVSLIDHMTTVQKVVL